MLSGLKVIQVFWPNEHCFKIFTCSSLESSFVDFTEVIKRFQLKSVSVINSQLFWWTNYSVMWRCNLYLCFGEGPLLHVFCLQHFISYFYLACCVQLFSSATISFLHCPSCNVGPKWESLVILARISFSSRYTGVTQSCQPSMLKQTIRRYCKN